MTGVYFSDKYIGYSHSFMKVQGSKKGSGYILENKTNLDIPMLGTIEKFTLETSFILSKNRTLEKGSIDLRSSQYRLKGTVKKMKDSKFKVILNGPGGKAEKIVDLSGKIVNSSFTPILPSYLPIRKTATFYFSIPY